MTRRSAACTTSSARRRLAAIVLGIVGVAGLGIASASQVTLSGNPLGAGATTVTSCQGTTPITVSFTTAWQSSPPGYRATRVTLTGVAAACGGLGYKIRILDASGNALSGLSDLTGTVPTGGGTVTSPTFGATPVTGIGQVAVVIQ